MVEAARALQPMPAATRSQLSGRVWLVVDVYATALSLQQERLDGASSSGSAALAVLPDVPAEVSCAHGLQFVLTLQGRCDDASGGTKPAARRGRGAGGRRGAAAPAAVEAGCLDQRWLEAAADCIAAKGVRRPYGPVSLACNWGPLWALLRAQGLDACPQLGTAWRWLVLRVLA